ncbi:MAG: formate dehydrogenase accessory sulfurtransferase FdhD [Myxococcota bacterium]
MDEPAIREVVTGPRGGGGLASDRLAVEEPLEIRVDGVALAVLLRTPGDDRALVAGFLLSEGLIDGADDLAAIEPCLEPSARERPEQRAGSEDGRAAASDSNRFNVRLQPGCADLGERLEAARRRFSSGASCGLCGKASIESLARLVQPRAGFSQVAPEFLASAAERARGHQRLFDLTGGTHAAVLFGPGPERAVVASAEDVGRHNAVDKIAGRLLLEDRLPDGRSVLWLSGRVSFEMVQKALLLGVGAVVAVGAPTSLAVELARANRLTLHAFLEGGRYNLYAGDGLVQNSSN